MENTPSTTKSSFRFGIYLGLSIIVASYLVFLFQLYENQITSQLSTVVLIVGIIIGIKSRRDNELNGTISYSSALGYGTLISLFSSIISAIGLIIYLNYIDDGFVQFTIDAEESKMYEKGLPEEQIEMGMVWVKKFMQPIPLSLMSVLMTTFTGFIISLIASIFLKKEGSPFDDVEEA